MMTGTLVKEFLQSRSVNEATRQKYRNVINGLLNYFETKGITEPNGDAVISYVNNLRGQRKSDYTIRLYLTVAKMFLNFLSRRGYCPDLKEPLKIKIRKSITHNRKALSQYQAEKLLSAVKGEDIKSLRDKAIIALALTTGMRTIEIERADIADLSPSVDCYTLRVQGKGRLVKDEIVKVVSWVAELIFKYLNARELEEGTAPLFASTARNRKKYGERLSAQSVGKILKLRMKLAGIDDRQITAHSTRHYAATCAIKAGVDIREVSQMLRHSSINVTMTYLHDISVETRRAEKLIAATLEKAAFQK